MAAKTPAGSEPLTTEYCFAPDRHCLAGYFYAHLKEVFMYIRRFKYKPDDVDCRLCTEFKKRKCTLEGCPWIAERIEAGVVSFAEAVMKVFSSYGLLRHRLADLVDSYPGTFWIDERHRNRMERFNHQLGYHDVFLCCYRNRFMAYFDRHFCFWGNVRPCYHKLYTNIGTVRLYSLIHRFVHRRKISSNAE